MRTLLNIIWFCFCGIWLAAGYFVAGVIGCLFIVTIPAGLASFRMAQYVLSPFGKAVVARPDAGVGSDVMNAIWFVIAGWWLAGLHVVTAITQSLTVIGLLNAVVSIKMIPISCFPFGKRIVDRDSLLPGQRPLHSV